jgi:hypothetical protein
LARRDTAVSEQCCAPQFLELPLQLCRILPEPHKPNAPSGCFRRALKIAAFCVDKPAQ